MLHTKLAPISQLNHSINQALIQNQYQKGLIVTNIAFHPSVNQYGCHAFSCA